MATSVQYNDDVYSFWWYSTLATSVQYNDDVYSFWWYITLATSVQYNGEVGMRVESRFSICD